MFITGPITYTSYYISYYMSTTCLFHFSVFAFLEVMAQNSAANAAAGVEGPSEATPLLPYSLSI